jgi:Phage portal protein, SPP1 Gp6-like
VNMPSGMAGTQAWPGSMMPGNEFLGMAIPVPRPIPENEPGSDLQNGIMELGQAQLDYAKAAAYYFGTQPEFFASLRLRIAMGATGVIFNFNFAKLPVDAVAERLEIAGVSSPHNDAAAAAIRETWLANHLDLYGPDIMKNMCKFGDAYVFVWPSSEQELLENADPPYEEGTTPVDIFYCSPRIMRLFYDDENEHIKRYAIKKWEDSATGYTFANLYYPDRIEKYMIAPSNNATSGAKPRWMKRLDPEDGEEWPLPNPFGEIPVFHFRNELPYGRPEHLDAFGPQDAIHKLVISHMASVDYNAFPQRYAILNEGYDTSEAAFGDEGDYAFSIDTGATLDTGIDPRSQLTADPASLWFMKGVKQYGQFDAADPKAFLNPFMDYIHAMAVVTQTPMHFLDPIVSNVSGESLRVIEAPFAKKVRKRQMSAGAAWVDLFRFVLKLKGFSRSTPVHINWVPAATVNDLATLQAQQIKFQLGVPARQLLEEQGYTPEQLDSWGITLQSQAPGLFETEGGESPVGTPEEI